MEARVLMKKNVLLNQIYEKQKDMYLQAKNYGFTHPTVIRCSQELDTLLNTYQNLDSLLIKKQSQKAM